MNPGGKCAGGGSKGKKGGGKNGGGGEKLTRSFGLVTAKAHISTLRYALQTDDGRDRDVTEKFAPFLTYKRNGLDLTLRFATSAKLDKAQLRFAKQTMSAQASAALDACAITLEDKVADLKDPAARFLFIYSAPAADGEDAPLVGFCHFRFTLQGELLEQMEGLPVLLISELFLVPSLQRKGVGSHTVNLLTLVARACNMAGVMVSMFTALAPACTPFLTQKLKGFALDAEWTPDDDAGLTVYYKPAVPLPPSAPATPSAAAAPIAVPSTSSPDSVLAHSASPASPDGAAAAGVEARGGAPAALAAQFERVSVQDAPTPAAEVPFWARVAAPEVATVESASESEEESEEEEDDDERADRLLDELCVLFEQHNGRAPTEEEVELWKTTLAEASVEAGAADDAA